MCRVKLDSLTCGKGEVSDFDPIDVPCLVNNVDSNTDVASHGHDRPATCSTHAELALPVTLQFRLPVVVGAAATTGPFENQWLGVVVGA